MMNLKNKEKKRQSCLLNNVEHSSFCGIIKTRGCFAVSISGRARENRNLRDAIPTDEITVGFDLSYKAKGKRL